MESYGGLATRWSAGCQPARSVTSRPQNTGFRIEARRLSVSGTTRGRRNQHSVRRGIFGGIRNRLALRVQALRPVQRIEQRTGYNRFACGRGRGQRSSRCGWLVLRAFAAARQWFRRRSQGFRRRRRQATMASPPPISAKVDGSGFSSRSNCTE
jgi:hypothetical protein